MTTTDKPRCDGRVWTGWEHVQCSRTGSTERNGRHYCGTHDPERREARRAKRQADALLEYERLNAASEAKRRADRAAIIQGATTDEVFAHPAVAALVAERDRLREAAYTALIYCQRHGAEVCYGGFHGGDPRDFTPDPECSTDEERQAHADACAAFEAAEARGESHCLADTHTIEVLDVPDVGPRICHVARNPYGLGTTVYRDDEIAELDAVLVAAMSPTKVATRAAKETP